MCSPQRRHRFRRRERHVERGDRLGDVFPRRPFVHRARRHSATERHLGRVATYGSRVDQPTEESVHVCEANAATQAELVSARARPDAWCLASPGVVVVSRRGDLVSEIAVAVSGGDASN